MTIALQNSIIYGPVNSRRFGNSLGVNLLPSDRKVCSFDCIYCQYDEGVGPEEGIFPSMEMILSQAKEAFHKLGLAKEKADWITLSGNGEPTLHPDFCEIVDRLIALRNEYCPGIPIGILSNSSTCWRPGIHDSLLKLDDRFMKLDAGDPHLFYLLDQPKAPAQWGQIISGLYRLHKLKLQSMFVQGVLDNTTDAVAADWIRTVQYVHPEHVHIYTTRRTTRMQGIFPVSHETLQKIADRLLTETGITASVFN